MKIGKICWLLICLALGPFFVGGAQSQQPQPMIEPHAQAMPLLPFLDYLIDESMAMDIEEVAGMTQGWQPFVPDRLPRVEGMLWLRFTIAPLSPDARPRTFLLDMGQSVPGQPVLYDPVQNELSGNREWRENVPAQRNILLLPEAGPTAAPCYIRLEGLPGPWFAPMIRTPQNAASNWDSLARTGSILALAVVMLLCILRGLSEKGQWRYWTALFVAFSLAQAILGMPRQTQHFGVLDLAATLCPGLALMCLPHAGRHLMNARMHSRGIDVQLFLLSLPGAALALLPLAPGWDWLDRWVDLWPVGAVLFIPTALGAWIMRLPGSRRFLLACVLPPIFVGFAMLGMEFGLSSSILASGPIWGVALAALLLAAIKAPQSFGEQAGPKAKGGKKPMPTLSIASDDDEVIALEHPLDDPNLRIIHLEPEPAAVESAPQAVPPLKRSVSGIAMQAEEARENALREPVDEILRETAALRQCALPPSARESTAALAVAAQKLATILSSPDLPSACESPTQRVELFNLQRVVRAAHDSVAAIAECSGIALSWYMPPHLAQLYHGDARALESTLRLLLESSVRCSRHGAIKLTARQVPGSQEKGHLLFTVSDDGEGFPPHDRSSLALARAWELTGLHGGYLSVESSHEGTTIAFTAHFTPDETELTGPEQVSHVILASDEAEARHQLARIIAAIRCEVLEAGTHAEAVTLQKQRPTCLLIAQGRFARPAAGDVVREFCRLAREVGLASCHALAITKDDSQWGLLKTSGFTHAMLEPVDPEVLRRTVAGLMKIHMDDNSLPNGEQAGAEAAPPARAETAPTMLIEQNFSLRAGFEGPDWLGEVAESPDQDKAPGRLAAPVPTARPEPAQARQSQDLPERDEVPREEPQAMSGTPGPEIAPPAGRSATEVEAGSKRHAAEAASEWVGEPTPVDKQLVDKPLVDKPLMDKPLVDYIVGVEAETKNKPEVQEQPLGDGSQKIKTFMEGSASIVKNALSGILKPKIEPEAKTEAPAQQATTQRAPDPEVANLLTTMEVLMEEAQTSFVAKNCAGVAEAIARLVQESERFGLRILTRMALCVQRAAEAEDMPALHDLLPELSHAVERTTVLIKKSSQEK